MTATTPPRPALRIGGRSFLALVLRPEPPLPAWLDGLDALLQRAPGFFAGRAVLLDLAAAPLAGGEVKTLLAELLARGVRVTGLEGADPAVLGPGLPPALSGGRAVDVAPSAEVSPGKSGPEAPPAKPASLLLTEPVRSGRSVVFPEGDVTVVGSVASGAEVVAGGSIHVYGALRGRALAGVAGHPEARIFCRRLEAELLAIDGTYKTADEIGAELQGRPVQALLAGDAVVLAALD